MGEIGNSIAEAIRKRTASAALGTYLFFWLAFHWEGIYSTLFTSEDKIFNKTGLLKNEYVNQYFFGWNGWFDWHYYLGYLVPLALTVLFIWPFSKYVLIEAYKIEQEQKTARRRVKFDEDEKRQKYEIKDIKLESTKVEAETVLSETKKRAVKVDPEIIWNDEYESFRQSKYYEDFNYLIDSIYQHAGQIKDAYNQYSGKYDFEIPRETLVYADTNGLLELSADKKKVNFTDKGRYFVKLFSNEKGIK